MPVEHEETQTIEQQTQRDEGQLEKVFAKRELTKKVLVGVAVVHLEDASGQLWSLS